MGWAAGGIRVDGLKGCGINVGVHLTPHPPDDEENNSALGSCYSSQQWRKENFWLMARVLIKWKKTTLPRSSYKLTLSAITQSTHAQGSLGLVCPAAYHCLANLYIYCIQYSVSVVVRVVLTNHVRVGLGCMQANSPCGAPNWQNTSAEMQPQNQMAVL